MGPEKGAATTTVTRPDANEVDKRPPPEVDLAELRDSPEYRLGADEGIQFTMQLMRSITFRGLTPPEALQIIREALAKE